MLSRFTNFWLKQNDSAFEIKTSSHLSSGFCADISSIIEKVFKGKNKSWKIVVKDGTRLIEKRVDVNELKFIQISEDPFAVKLSIVLPEIEF